MEKIVERNMLYDFYGELLTPHQQEIYESIIFQDLSLSEVAEIHGISRQGVHDLVRRCDKLLEGYEKQTASGRALCDTQIFCKRIKRTYKSI